MKVSVDFEIATIDHSISIRKDLGEYKAIISRLQPPFVSIEYDHVLKSGVPLDNYEGNDKDALFKKAIGYGIHNLKFDDIEIIMFKQLPSIQKQFEDFRKSLPKEKLKGWTLKRFLNRKPFTLE